MSSGQAPGRQLPPPLARMSSSGFGNFQGRQECLLKCSRPWEQKEQNGAPGPACACGKQAAITQTGWLHRAKEMNAAVWNLYHPKGERLLNHRDSGETKDLMTPRVWGHEGGTLSRHWTSSSCHRCPAYASFGGMSGGGSEAWRGSPSRDHAHAHTHSHARTLSHPHPQALSTRLLAPSLPRFWPPPPAQHLDGNQDLNLIRSDHTHPSPAPPPPSPHP